MFFSSENCHFHVLDSSPPPKKKKLRQMPPASAFFLHFSIFEQESIGFCRKHPVFRSIGDENPVYPSDGLHDGPLVQDHIHLSSLLSSEKVSFVARSVLCSHDLDKIWETKRDNVSTIWKFSNYITWYFFEPSIQRHWKKRKETKICASR